MTPAYQRFAFIGFGLLLAGVLVNVVLLQPAQTAGRSADTAQAKLEQERRQRLALERLPATSAAAATKQPAAVEPEPAKSDASKSAAATPSASAPPRATSGGPRPIAIQAPMEQGARRFARLKPDAAKADAIGDTLPDAPEAEGDPETIRAVQRELSSKSYGPLVSDGVPGLVTRAAIMAFEHDNRMPLTGEATEKLLARLLLGTSGAAGDATDPAAGRVRSPHAESVMRTVQQSLIALGYQAGRVDGRAGEETERAIREFEMDEGLKQTGRVSAEVFSRLGRVVASAKPQPVR